MKQKNTKQSSSSNDDDDDDDDDDIDDDDDDDDNKKTKKNRKYVMHKTIIAESSPTILYDINDAEKCKPADIVPTHSPYTSMVLLAVAGEWDFDAPL